MADQFLRWMQLLCEAHVINARRRQRELEDAEAATKRCLEAVRRLDSSTQAARIAVEQANRQWCLPVVSDTSGRVH